MSSCSEHSWSLTINAQTRRSARSLTLSIKYNSRSLAGTVLSFLLHDINQEIFNTVMSSVFIGTAFSCVLMMNLVLLSKLGKEFPLCNFITMIYVWNFKEDLNYTEIQWPFGTYPL